MNDLMKLAKATLEFRQFCDEYHLRCLKKAGNKQRHIMEGDRVSDKLTASGERKLIESDDSRAALPE